MKSHLVRCRIPKIVTHAGHLKYARLPAVIKNQNVSVWPHFGHRLCIRMDSFASFVVLSAVFSKILLYAIT